MSLKKVADIRAAESPELIEVRVVKKWRPHTPNLQKKTDLWFLFVDVHGDAIESTCLAKDASHFEGLLELQKCYKLNGYVSKPGRSYMPMVPHRASLFLGRRVTVQHVDNYDIPTYYYNLASYDELNSRKTHPKLLTDFIGRVDSVSPILLRKNKRLRKIGIRDIAGNPLEITLWEEKANLIQPEGAVGKAIVVTATTVTQYELLQLESTVSTSVELNPNFPELQSYIDKFTNLDNLEDIQPELQTLTVAELAARFRNGGQRRGHFLCHASIVSAFDYRGWYYVNCHDCGERAHAQNDGYVCAHCMMPGGPEFRYSFNTIIKDHTSTIEAGFFDESLYSLLGITCHTLVVTKDNLNPKKLPPELQALIGVPLVLTVNIKPNATLGVDNAKRATTIDPPTPNPKNKSEKRPSTSSNSEYDKEKQLASPKNKEGNDNEQTLASDAKANKKQKAVQLEDK